MSVVFEDNRMVVKAAINDASVAWLYEAAGEVQAQAQRNARVKTGQTRGSYEYHVDEGNLEAEIGSNYQNAIWEEFGTGEYALNGDGRKGGWKYVDAEGQGHFTRGKRPNRTLYNAFSALQGKLIEQAESKFKNLDSGSSGGGSSSGDSVKDLFKYIKNAHDKTVKIVNNPTSALPKAPTTPSLPKAPTIKDAVSHIPTVGKTISKGMK